MQLWCGEISEKRRHRRFYVAQSGSYLGVIAFLIPNTRNIRHIGSLILYLLAVIMLAHRLFNLNNLLL